MKRVLAIAALASLVAMPAYAIRNVGDTAPDFSADASLNGKEIKFSLAESLKKGPVVVYFYPAAFTPGCTVEAHAFAEKIDKFAALKTTVIGVSADPIDTLNKFSVSECQGKFAVAADPNSTVIKQYDAVSDRNPTKASRTSYVVAPGGKIIYAYTSQDPQSHVDNTMAAVEKWNAEHKN